MIEWPYDFLRFICLSLAPAILLYLAVKIGLPRLKYSKKDIDATGFNRSGRRHLTKVLKRKHRLAKNRQ